MSRRPRGVDAAWNPAATPSFNLTLRDDETCTGDAAVRILYADLDVGWGVAPSLCVPRRAAGEVKVILVAPRRNIVTQTARPDVRMASDKHVRGDLEFQVEMEMIGADQSFTSNLCLLVCDAKQRVGSSTSPCDILCQ
jgi:hypothetical protein